MKKSIFAFLSVICLFACQTKKTSLKAGTWRAVIKTDGGDLPFGLDISPNADSLTYTVYAINGKEKLMMDSASVWGDSIKIPMEIFDAELIGKIDNDDISGIWQKKRTDGTFVKAPFSAKFGETHRFHKQAQTKENLSGKWQTVFTSETDTTQAIGVFEQNGSDVTGTFLTATGDYRYLAGNVMGDSLLLSCYDGTHVYLFKAQLSTNKQTLNGKFWSNGNNLETWTAHRNNNATLPDAKSLTQLKAGYESVSFSFPDIDGKMVSLQDQRFRNKVVIVQIMGSWCPNCMDESNFLAPWYKKNKARGVEIVGLAFEKNTDLAITAPKLAKLKTKLQITYPILLAGKNNKELAAAALPALNQVMSFPTTIFIDRKGKVREIHTGFSGPGTGKYYDDFVADFERLTDKLLDEK